MIRRSLLLVVLFTSISVGVLAQNPTGTLSGHVTDGKDALPGVTITATSPAMQGTRAATTTANGDYIFTFLPPGDYRVKFELQGFQTVDTTVKVNAAQTQRIDATMPQTKVTEEVTVTGTYETVSSSAQASTTISNALTEKLPVTKDVTTAVALTPAVTQNGPRNALTISGANSYDNLFLINGVTVNENIRGGGIPLYIEDAVQETTTSTSAVSAEYGRFNGGVVNTLTRSGGNEIHGSVRDTLNNDKWTAPTPKTPSRIDNITPTYEATLGGFFLKDRLWFFGAGRDYKLNNNNYTTNDGTVPSLAIAHTLKDQRVEAKLTFALNPNNRLIASYIYYKTAETGREFYPAADLNTQIEPLIPNDLKAFNYTGVLTDNFFVEGQYSYRKETFKNYGCPYNGDLINGTPIYDYTLGTQANCSIFGANRGGPETRNNEDILAKGSWFLSTTAMGSHDLVFGLDQYKDMRQANNYQSSTDFVLDSDHTLYNTADPSIIYPVFFNDGLDMIDYWPIAQPAKQNDLRTQSGFINDRWRLNNNFSFNIGVRYDKNHAVNEDGAVTANDNKVSPRLALTYDPSGDNSMQVSAGYGKYVAAQQQNFLDANAAGGQPAFFGWLYDGPEINTNCDPANPTPTTCIPTQQAIQMVFNWFNSYCDAHGNCGTKYPAGPSFYGASIGYLNTKIDGSLRSPSADEFTLSASKRFGTTGLVRFDYINRKYVDLYEQEIDQSTGQVSDPFGNVYDVQKWINAPSYLNRKYWAYILQWQFRLIDKLDLGGNYTFSRAYGNVGTVENTGSGPIGNYYLNYPEFKQLSWNSPTADASIDQRHRARLYLIYDIFNTRHNRLSASLLQSYFSGTPYGASGSVRSINYVDSNIVAKYATPPPSVTYWYTSPDAFHWASTIRTDLGVDYSFHVPALGSDLEFFLNPRVTNVFNRQAVIAGSTTIYDPTNSSNMKAFNPFTTPHDSLVECPQGTPGAQCKASGANWQPRATFGQPTSAASYQTPRTFYLTLGVRF